MKYIIDIPDEKTYAYINDEKTFLRMPISLGENEIKSMFAPTMLRIKPYIEPDRKAIEDEAWGLAERIADMSYDDFISCFEGETEEYVYGLTYHEVKAKYEAWKKRKEEIHVGDEVKIANTIGVVTRVPEYDEQRVHYIAESGTVYCNNAYADIVKTGRHFDEVESLLKKMEED